MQELKTPGTGFAHKLIAWSHVAAAVLARDGGFRAFIQHSVKKNTLAGRGPARRTMQAFSETFEALIGLYDAIEAGIADLDDPALKERIAGLKVIRDQARIDADRAQALLDSPGHSAISPTMIQGFAHRARERIRGSEGGYRRDHLRSLAQRVEVADDAVRIMGSKTELLRTLIAGQVRQSAAIGVPRSGLKWRAEADETENYTYAIAL